MKKVMTAAFALSALFAASPKAHAEVNYPWCIIGDTRTLECYFSSREQCAQDGRNRGFGSQCMPNPFYKPGAPTVSGPVNKRTVSQSTRPSQAASAAHQSAPTCTGLKLASLSGTRNRCLYLGGASEARPLPRGPFCENQCNFIWEQCMKSGFWEGTLIHRQAERR